MIGKFEERINIHKTNLIKNKEMEMQANKNDLQSNFGWFEKLMKDNKDDKNLLIKLKEFVKTKDFWADEFIHNLFKKELKIKITLLNQYNYKSGMDYTQEQSIRNVFTYKKDDDVNNKPNYYIF